eukprot:m.240731 g.240731  ORF g.240731 m.240731 type:complete len:358 (+) comp15871_c0_seq1:142-1215(+)
MSMHNDGKRSPAQHQGQGDGLSKRPKIPSHAPVIVTSDKVALPMTSHAQAMSIQVPGPQQHQQHQQHPQQHPQQHQQHPQQHPRQHPQQHQQHPQHPQHLHPLNIPTSSPLDMQLVKPQMMQQECEGIKQKGAKQAPCGDNHCVKCLQANCCKRCPNEACGAWAAIARKTCRACNYRFSSKAQEARQKHASWTGEEKIRSKPSPPSAFEQSIQRKISNFYNARDGLFVGICVYSGRSVVSRVFHNKHSFLAPSVQPPHGMQDQLPQLAAAEEIASRELVFADPLLANNPTITSAVRGLQQEIAQYVEHLEESLKDYLTIMGTTGNRSRKIAEKLVRRFPTTTHQMAQHQQQHPLHLQ